MSSHWCVNPLSLSFQDFLGLPGFLSPFSGDTVWYSAVTYHVHVTHSLQSCPPQHTDQWHQRINKNNTLDGIPCELSQVVHGSPAIKRFFLIQFIKPRNRHCGQFWPYKISAMCKSFVTVISGLSGSSRFSFAIFWRHCVVFCCYLSCACNPLAPVQEDKLLDT